MHPRMQGNNIKLNGMAPSYCVMQLGGGVALLCTPILITCCIFVLHLFCFRWYSYGKADYFEVSHCTVVSM